MVSDREETINYFYKHSLKKEIEKLARYREMGWSETHPSIKESKILIKYLKDKVSGAEN